ncbi:glycosyltransferase family 4 protein [Dyadobacter flavalbus]|uniref:Glycosyltransferase family 4 protein n=1 Tax=Dyadobacter flavalbus TaxID=2579942 RepID=A0A5M8QNB7_9BACT|nr:glycosyltransferase [Dyadobacter flavalbus]KAA6436758.1 glycosyltransferase family 4 protein [Dyadobacter flavalbus]
MKLVYFYRPKMKGVHSIETVFGQIKSGMPDDVAYKDYVCTSKWMRYHSFIKASKFQGDINHITGDIHTISLFLDKKKTIVTVHDVGRYERDLKGIKKWIFKLVWLTFPLRRASYITTISEFTKRKLVEICKIPENKIRVIPNPAPEDFQFSYKEFDQKLPVVMQIGSGNNKNIYRLIEAVKDTDFRLLLIRKPDQTIKDLLISYKIPFEWHTDLSRSDVYECYKKCDILFFASEYEGFGVPILEANIIGRPVITSNISAMPDVAHDAALLINPFSTEEIKEALLRIKQDADLRERLVQNGLANVARFSKHQISNQYYSLYNEILKNTNE